MGMFAVPFAKSSANVRQFVSVNADATRPRRGTVYDVVFGCKTNADDNQYVHQIRRVTGAPTGAGVTPNPMYPGDTTEFDATDTVTSDAASFSGGAGLFEEPLNGRSTFRWTTSPENGIVYPATANNGL